MQNPEETPQNLMTSAVLIYNQSIHSTTGHLPFSILYGPYINEPNIDNDLTLFEQYNERRKKELLPFHEQIYKIAHNKQSKNTQKHNNNTNLAAFTVFFCFTFYKLSSNYSKITA